MLIGLALIVAKFGSLDFGAVLGAPGDTIAKGTATAIALLLFAGAIGKSAQVPLHVWLPDAMAGPTPVSALIHAATMVTAGVYLVVRSAPLFELSGVALTVVLIVGLVTALFAATCALAQDDIKRVLAYSTISQLGFMFMAAGMRFYTGAMFMLVAHAFYKALMFLGAGSVMHGMHEETDLQRMGGLIRRMPITGWTFVVGRVRPGRGPPARGLLREGPDPRDREPHGTHVDLPARDARGAAVRALHRSAPVPGVLRGAEERGGGARPRIAARDDRTAHGAGGRGRGDRPHPLDRRRARWRGSWSRWPDRSRPEGGSPDPRPLVIATAIALGALAVAWWVYASGRVDWLTLRERLQPLPRAAGTAGMSTRRIPRCS